MEQIDLETKIKAFSILGGHLGKTLREFVTDSHKGIANGDHIFIVEGNLYRVDLNTNKVTKV